MKKIIALAFASFIGCTLNAQSVSPKLSKTTILPDQVVSVIESSDPMIDGAANANINAALEITMESTWKKCKYEFVSLREIAESGKIGDYYIVVRSMGGVNSNGASTNYFTAQFGVSNKDIEKACNKYKKNKEQYDFINAITKDGYMVIAFLDPSLITADFNNLGGFTVYSEGKYKAPDRLDDLRNGISLGVKTINWLITTDLKKYSIDEGGTGKNFMTAVTAYNSNSCGLKKMTLLISASDTVHGRKNDVRFKGFELDEFKKQYSSEMKAETSLKIQEYISTDSTNQYALFVEGIYGRSPVALIVRVTDGAVLYGCYVENATAGGYKKRIYKKLEEICK